MVDWSIVLMVVLLALVILRADLNAVMLPTFIRQFLILVPGVLGEMIFLIAGRVDLSVGGTIVLLKQVLCWLILYQNLPFFPAVIVSFAVAFAVGFFKAVCTSSIRSPFEIITFGVGYLFASLASGMNLQILQNTTVITNVSNFTVPIYILTVVCVIYTCWFLEKTTVGRSVRIFGSDPNLSNAMHMPIRNILISASLLCSLLLTDYMLCQVSRTGLLTQLDSSNLTYNILAGGMIGTHIYRKYKNIYIGLLNGTLEIILFNSAVQFFGLPTMLIWAGYGIFILLSIFTTPVLNESIRSRIER